MNINRIFDFQILAIFFSIIIGGILHFTYQLSGGSNFVALFSAVNESTWEHLKLLVFPMLLFAIIEYFFINKYVNNYMEAKLFAIIIGMVFITVIFYTYSGILGNNYFIIDIAIFILSVILAECVGYKIMISKSFSNKITQALSIACVILIVIMFFVYTFNPPYIQYFQDPITKLYGIPLINQII